ncbi:MAG: hypothetical protein JF616_02665 [Fibrobacteres bacterium]|nr:hypothetical protein [Fibrobacterota bacterium]
MTALAPSADATRPLATTAVAGRERYLQWALGLLIFLSFFQNGITILINFKVRLIGFIILIILSWRGLLLPGRLRGYERAMLAWVGAGVAASLWDLRYGLDGQMAYGIVYNLISEFAWIMAYFAGRFAASKGVDFRRLFSLALIFGIVLTATAIAEKFFHEYIELYLLATSQNAYLLENSSSIFHRGYGFEESDYRCVSWVLEFIAFSYLCGVLALANLIFLLEYRKPRYVIGLLTAIAALFLTQSLSSLASCVLCSLIYLVFGKRIKISTLAWLGLAGAVFAAAFAFQKDGTGPFEGIAARLGGAISGKDQGLLIHFQEFHYSVIDNFTLFGHGLGTSDFLHQLMGKILLEDGHPTIEHEYFRLLYETGGFGFLIYLAAILMAAGAALRGFRAETDPWRKCASALIVLWFLMHFLVGFAHRSFPTYESVILPALLFGWLQYRERQSPPSRIGAA